MTETRAYVLMTAMPPTKGHRALIQYAACLAERVEVILCTQPGEPFTNERATAVAEMCDSIALGNRVHLNRVHKSLPQEPEGNEGFWDMWTGFLQMFGFEPGDWIVASEKYGKTLAEYANGIFMPFDIDRDINPEKATNVRNATLAQFDSIDESFQPHLIKTITVFGAESTGKTTLSRELADHVNGHWLPEYARPYLENTSNEINDGSMTRIWDGQAALQDYGFYLRNKPFIVQDTDLWSTVGYWEMSPWAMSGPEKVPYELKYDAQQRQSDLYIITRSNVPFEADPLRYGGAGREITDEQWIDFAGRYGLPYVVLDSPNFNDRLATSYFECRNLFLATSSSLHNYARSGSEYQNLDDSVSA